PASRCDWHSGDIPRSTKVRVSGALQNRQPAGSGLVSTKRVLQTARGFPLMLPITLGSESHAPLTMLCIGAHCDDIEIGCGGTILRLLAEHPGSSVHWVV